MEDPTKGGSIKKALQEGLKAKGLDPNDTTLGTTGSLVNAEEVIRGILEKVRKLENGCWLWTGRIHPRGYGRASVRFDLRSPLEWVMVHKFLFEFLITPVPEGKRLMRQCGTKSCVHPGHHVLILKAKRDRKPREVKSWQEEMMKKYGEKGNI